MSWKQPEQKIHRIPTALTESGFRKNATRCFVRFAGGEGEVVSARGGLRAIKNLPRLLRLRAAGDNVAW